jgi:ADP-heptose:LPS heptosyltransferase
MLSNRVYNWQFLSRMWLAGRTYGLKNPFKRTLPVQHALKPHRLLLISTGLLGDTIMSTPVIIEARRLWPDAEITLLGRRRNCELLSECPMIDQFKEATSLPFSLRGRAGVKALKEWMAEQSFDMAVILLGDEFAHLLAQADIPVRVGVRGHLLEPCLTHSYDIGAPRTWGPSERLNALRCLGLDVPDALPQLWVSDSARESVRQTLRRLGIDSTDRYIALHPFGSTHFQWWLPDLAPRLADELQSKYGLKTVLVGGPETKSYADKLSNDNLINSAGVVDIQELLALIEGAALVVSTDSGPFHIAGALGRPLVGLFRSRRPEHANRYPQAHVAFGEEPDCASRCSWDRCRSLPCLQLGDLSIERVLDEIGRVQTSIHCVSGFSE